MSETKPNCGIDKMGDHDLLQRIAQQLEDFEAGFGDLRRDFRNHLSHHNTIMIGVVGISLACAGALAFFLLTK